MAKKKSWCFITVSPNTKVKVDTEDRARLEKMSWRVTKGTAGRPRVVTGGGNVTLGKFLMKPPKGKQVYARRYFEGLDYRKDNLIVCTAAERQRMLPKRGRRGTSTYRGVSLQGQTGKWRAAVKVNGRSINLGEYMTEERAAMAYNEGARKYFGEMAYQNRVGENRKRRRGD